VTKAGQTGSFRPAAGYGAERPRRREDVPARHKRGVRTAEGASARGRIGLASKRLRARATHLGGALIEDAMIAATARVHGLQVVTRNVRDFKEFGVRVMNPYTFR